MNYKYGKKNLKKNNISYSDKKIDKQKQTLFKNRSLSSKNVFPHDSSYTIKTNQKKINNNEENVIANILKTNNIGNDLKNTKENDKINTNIKFSNKALSTSINVGNDYKEIGDFNYINISEKIKPFLYKPQKIQEYSSHAFNNFHFLDIDSTYRMIINILVDDDSLHSSNNLLIIFESIILSLNSLGEINISNKDFLVCIFFQHFSCEETFKSIFPGLNFYNCNNWNLKMNTFYCSYGEVLSVSDTPINVLSFYKESSTFVEVNQFFYCNILNDLITLISVNPSEIGKTFLVVNWPNGKIYEKSINKYHRSRILSNIFRISNNRNMILIPDINYHPYSKKDYFGYLLKYNFDSDKVYVNLMWEMMTSYPIDHRFFFINMNYNLYLVIKDYYQNNFISIYSNEYYYDYNFSIYLKKKMKNITIKKIQQVKIEYSDLSFNLIDFFYELSLKRGSEYANFFALISYFFSCNNMICSKLFAKITILFKLLIFFIEFFWLGLSLLVSYAVFNETFGSKGNKMDYFCSVGYAIIVIILILFSSIFIKNKPKIKRNKINRNILRNQDSYIIIIILYIIHYAYNIFFIVCSIIAVIHVDEGRNEREGNHDYYIFKKKYSILLLILIILFMILPSLIIRPTNLTSKGFLYYLIFQLLNSTCFFHLPYLFTCIRNINSSKRNYEVLYVSLYALLNGILTTICLIFDTKRRRRMDFFYVIASIIAILTGVRMIILIIGICLQNHFNRKISYGQIPQYNNENNEFDNNINDNKLNDNIFINNNDDLKLNKNININDSHLAIKSIYEKQNLDENTNMGLKDKNEVYKEYSSQADIMHNLLLNQSFEKEFKKENIYCLKSDNNINQKYPIIKMDENEQNQIKFIKNKTNNEINNSNNSDSKPLEKELSINNKISNQNNNNNDIKGKYYPFDTTINNNDSISDNYNYNKNYIMEEIKNVPENGQKNFVLDPNDIYNNENNSIDQSQIKKINKYDEANY